MNNTEIKNKFKKLLKEALKNYKKKESDTLVAELKKLASSLKESPVTQFIANMPKEIRVSNFEKAPDEVSIKNFPKETKISNFPDEIKIAKPKWWKDPEKQKEIQKVEITNKSEKPGWLDGVVSSSFAVLAGLMTDVSSKFFDVTSKFITKLWGTGLTVRFDKTQKMFLIDPHSGEPIGKKDLALMGGGGSNHTYFNAAGRDPVGIKNASNAKINPATEDKQAPYGAVGQGNASVATAGTPVPLSAVSVPCKRVFVQSHQSNGDLTNTGLIVVGGATVSAASATRAGFALFPTNGEWFLINNLNLLYIDSTDNGAKVHYYYEN